MKSPPAVPAQNVLASLRFEAEVERAEPAGLTGGLQGREPAAVDVPQQVADHQDTGDDEEHRLIRPGPDDRLDAAEGDEEDADHGEQGNRRGQRPVHDARRRPCRST